jgi:hypothetical protein
MRVLIQSLVLSVSLLALAGCKKEEAKPAQQAAPVQLVVPANNDDMAWREYLRAVVKQHMQNIRRSPYMYYFGAIENAESEEEWEDQYTRQFENVVTNTSRGVLPGNMLAFGSPESERMANLVVDAFKEVSAGSMKDVRVLFVGREADRERVTEAVAPSGAQLVFHPID